MFKSSVHQILTRMNRNVRWLSIGGGVRVAGFSMVVSFFFLYLRNTYNLPYYEVGILVALTGVLPLAILPGAGLLADRVGRRRLFLAALTAEGASLLLLSGATQIRWLPGLLALVTLVESVGALGGPAIQAYVADLTQGSDRTLAFTWLRIGGNLGFAGGVLLGGALIIGVGFTTLAFISGLVILGAAGLLTLVLERSPYEARAAGPRRSALGIGQSSEHKSIGQSIRLMGRDRVFLGFCVAFAIAALTADQYSVIEPLYVNAVLNVPYDYIGIGLAFSGLVVAVGQAPITRASLGHRHTVLFALGAVLYVVGFLLLGVPAVLGFGTVAFFLLSMFVVTLGENVESIPGSTLPSNLAPPDEIGAYNGAFFAFSGIGSLLAPVIGGIVLSNFSAPWQVWGLLSIPTLPALALLAYITPRISSSANTA